MNTGAIPWFEDEAPRDLRRWALAAFLVTAIHLSAIAAYVYGHRPDEVGDDTTPVAVEFAPGEDTVNQAEVAPVPEQPQPEVEKPTPPPPDTSQAVVAPPEEQPKIEQQPPPTPALRAQSKGGAPRIAPTWISALTKRLQLFKRYPSEARERGEVGSVQVTFTVDRTGRVLSSSVTRSSGHPALDREALALLARAQPLPVFSSTMTDTELELTIPISFDLVDR
jgi:protein TonB